MEPSSLIIVAAVILIVLVAIPLIVSSFLRNVPAGTVRMVSWLRGSTVTYRGPGKSVEVPLLTTGTTLSSKAINVDLDITDQTADIDAQGVPRPIKVRVLASAIVSVGDTDVLVKTAANRYFSKPEADQISILSDLLSSAGRRAINLLTHDQLFSARTSPAHQVQDEDDDPLAIIIRKACSKELTDLGLIFNSLNIKVVQSEVAEARRRQSAAEAQANADIVATQQTRRAKEAQIEADRAISDRQRDLEQTRASNAALIADAEAKKQDSLATQRIAELKATQIAQAEADAQKVRIAAEASSHAEAIRITTVAEANAESIRKVNDAIRQGGEAYFRYRQIELLPEIAPLIAEALAKARLITVSGGGEGGAAGETTSQITDVIRTVLTMQLVTKGSSLDAPAPELVGR